MIDLAFAAMLAAIGTGLGLRVLDRLGEAPEHLIDAAALSLPIGWGLLSMGTLALGEVGWLDRVGMMGLLAVSILVGHRSWSENLRRQRPPTKVRANREGEPGCAARQAPRLLEDRERSSIFWRGSRLDDGAMWSGLDRTLAVMASVAILGTAIVCNSPVTDGDALCYHLQVPKVFLWQRSVGYDPDLHETVYPLLTEMLDAIVLAFRGPVACRWIPWFLGLSLMANVSALARPTLGSRAWWAGVIVLLAPAISNGMSAPLNDLSLAAFGAAAIHAWSRLLDRPTGGAAVVAGMLSGMAVGVKYPALVLVVLLGLVLWVQGRGVSRWRSVAIYTAMVFGVGGWWYLRAYLHTGNPVYPFFRHVFGGAGLDEVLDPIKRPMVVTPWNLFTSLAPLTLQPDRFDSFSHQFGPIFLLFLPAALLERPGRRVLGLAALGYLYLMLCLTQRQSMRFVLIALGPLSVAVACGLSAWAERRSLAARSMIAMMLMTLGFESAWAMARGLPLTPMLAGRESAESLLARREPTYIVGRWAEKHLPATARLIGQDHRGFYIPRPYTMELAHRRRTGLGRHGENAGEIVDRLREEGFTHLLLCPPVPENAVEFDPTLSRRLASWLSGRSPIYREDLTDGDGVVRRYAIYELNNDRLASAPGGGSR